jgi:nitrogen PTS system EIIA component
MRLTEILTADRIFVDPTGAVVGEKSKVLAELARLLSVGSSADPILIEHQLAEREKLQSTGIGDGVAIPHTSVEEFSAQKAALILAPRGVEFESIDGLPATIIFGVVGPKRAASEHLKILAKVSRLLRSPETRRRLLEAAGPEQAYTLIEEHEGSSVTP